MCFWLFPSSKQVHKVGNRHLSLSTTRLEPPVYVRGIKGWICTAPPGYARTGVRAYISYVEPALLHCCFGVSKMRPIPTHTLVQPAFLVLFGLVLHLTRTTSAYTRRWNFSPTWMMNIHLRRIYMWAYRINYTMQKNETERKILFCYMLKLKFLEVYLRLVWSFYFFCLNTKQCVEDKFNLIYNNHLDKCTHQD